MGLGQKIVPDETGKFFGEELRGENGESEPRTEKSERFTEEGEVAVLEHRPTWQRKGSRGRGGGGKKEYLPRLEYHREGGSKKKKLRKELPST